MTRPRNARGFTLIEVLVAIALFGAAVAGLLAAVGPTYGALADLSNVTSDAGDLELIKGVVESTANRQTLLEGGKFALPSGEDVSWQVELMPTDTEAMYLVKLHATRGDRTPLDYEYLSFNPNWRDTTEERPRWLQHSFGTGGGGGGGGGGGPGGQNGGNRGPNDRNGNNNGNGNNRNGNQNNTGNRQGQGSGDQGRGNGAQNGRGNGNGNTGNTGGNRGGQSGGGARGGR